MVAEHDAAEQRFLEMVLLAERRWGVEIPALFTARPRFERHPRNPEGTLGPIWRTLDSPERVRWLEAIESGER